MFICNVKINGKLWFKILLIFMGLIVLSVFFFSVHKLFVAQQEVVHINDKMQHSNITEITSDNYTNILKAVHDNLDWYLGKEIKFSGYVYRIIDFSDKQFVLARDMIVDSKAYVVGFLCEYDKVASFETGTWVDVSGTISQGKYHNQIIPIITVRTLNSIEAPDDKYVLPPSDTYIPTSAVL